MNFSVLVLSRALSVDKRRIDNHISRAFIYQELFAFIECEEMYKVFESAKMSNLLKTELPGLNQRLMI